MKINLALHRLEQILCAAALVGFAVLVAAHWLELSDALAYLALVICISAVAGLYLLTLSSRPGGSDN